MNTRLTRANKTGDSAVFFFNRPGTLKTERCSVVVQKNRLPPANAEVGIVLFPTRCLGETNMVSGREKVASTSSLPLLNPRCLITGREKAIVRNKQTSPENLMPRIPFPSVQRVLKEGM